MNRQYDEFTIEFSDNKILTPQTTNYIHVKRSVNRDDFLSENPLSDSKHY